MCMVDAVRIANFRSAESTAGGIISVRHPPFLYFIQVK